MLPIDVTAASLIGGNVSRDVADVRGRASCVCYFERERWGVGARTRIYTRCSTARVDTDTRVTIIEKERAWFVSSIMGWGLRIECRWLPPIAAVTLTHGRVPFALDQLPGGSFTGFVTPQTGYARFASRFTRGSEVAERVRYR